MSFVRVCTCDDANDCMAAPARQLPCSSNAACLALFLACRSPVLTYFVISSAGASADLSLTEGSICAPRWRPASLCAKPAALEPALHAMTNQACFFYGQWLSAQGIHVNASSWPGTSYFLKRRDVPAIVQSPGVAEIAKDVGKRPPQACTFKLPMDGVKKACQHNGCLCPSKLTSASS